MALQQRPGVAGVALEMGEARGVGVERRVGGHLLEGGQAEGDIDMLHRLRRHFKRALVQHLPAFGHGAEQHGGAANVGHRRHRLAAGGAVGDLDNRALGVAIGENVGPAIEQYRAPHLIGPIVVMSDTA